MIVDERESATTGDDVATSPGLIAMLNKSIATRLLLSGLLAATLSACANTGGNSLTESSSVLPSTDPFASVSPVSSTDGENYEQLSARAAQAYGRGDLDEAESLFVTLQQRNPNDPRAVYNLAILNLQRAYDGIQRYIVLETGNSKRLQAEELLRRLSELK